MTIWHDLLAILAVAVVAILVAVALAAWCLSKISHDVATPPGRDLKFSSDQRHHTKAVRVPRHTIPLAKPIAQTNSIGASHNPTNRRTQDGAAGRLMISDVAGSREVRVRKANPTRKNRQPRRSTTKIDSSPIVRRNYRARLKDSAKC